MKCDEFNKSDEFNDDINKNIVDSKSRHGASVRGMDSYVHQSVCVFARSHLELGRVSRGQWSASQPRLRTRAQMRHAQQMKYVSR